MATQEVWHEPSSGIVDPPGVVIHPPVSYDPETVELHPRLKSQDLRLQRNCVLRWSCWISFINVILAIAIAFAMTVPMMLSSQSRYEPCIIVSCLVVAASISVGCLRKEGEKIALQNAAPSKKFICFYVSTFFLSLSALSSVAVVTYLFVNGEFSSCSKAKTSEDLENLCSEEFEIRFVCSLLTIVFLTCIAALSMLLFVLFLCVVYRFSYLKVAETDEDAVGKVIVTRKDKKGHKVIYAYKSEEVHRLEPR